MEGQHAGDCSRHHRPDDAEKTSANASTTHCSRTIRGSLSLLSLIKHFAFSSIDVPIRGAQFAADRIAPIRSDLKSHDSNRNPKFRSIRCDVFTVFEMFRVIQIARFNARDSDR